MKKFNSLIVLFLIISVYIGSDEINFAPELIWWINEIKTVNNDVEINKFLLLENITQKFDNKLFSSQFLVYPVFMRWNYSGNMVAYYNYNYISLRRQSTGKYKIYSGDADSIFVLADRNKNVFFYDTFGSLAGIDSYYWLTDTVLICVGTWVNLDELVDLVIKEYSVNSSVNTVEIKTFLYKNAITIENRNRLKLKWYQQRFDYFEVD